MRSSWIGRFFKAALLASATALPAHSDSVLTLKVGYGPGGSTDVGARILSRYLPEYSAAFDKAIVENVAGAGGMKLLRMAGASKADAGETVYLLSFAAITTGAMDDIRNGDTPGKPKLLASLMRDLPSCMVPVGSEIVGVDQILRDGVKFGALGPSNTSYRLPAALRSGADLDLTVVTGYSGAAEAFAALERGEVDVVCSLLPPAPDSFRTIGYFGPIGYADPSGLPNITDLVADDETRTLIELLALQSVPKVVVFMSEHAPDDAVEAMRAAIESTIRDPGFVADFERTAFDLTPTDAAELEALFEPYRTMDRETLEKLTRLVE